MSNTIAVITPSHPARLKNNMLTQALHSASAQTLAPDEFHVRIDNERAGAAPTRHAALMAATTDWVAFLDSDDLWMPNHLQDCLNHALETGADFVYSWYKILITDQYGLNNVMEEDPIFPPGHYLNDFDPEDPIETTITTLVRRELAQEVGFQKLERGERNSGEDRFFTIGCLNAGGKISHLVRKTWYWRHHKLRDGTPGNTSGLPGKGDWVL